MSPQSKRFDIFKSVIFPSLFFLALICLATSAGAKTITVTGAGDAVAVDGAVTLREAICAANLNQVCGDAPAGDAGLDTIAFNIPGSGVKTIQPLTPLPTIIDPITIDGYTQPGASPNTMAIGNDAVLLIELDGAKAGTDFNAIGFHLLAGNSRIQGLVVNGFHYTGIQIGISNPGNNVIEGNFVGTDPTGTQARPNFEGGIWIYQSPNNLIGGTSPAARNVISGNGEPGFFNGKGIELAGHDGMPASPATIQNNYIGTDAAGTSALRNTGAGIEVSVWVDVTVGGTGPAARNVISGNLRGIDVGDGADLKILGNYVGTDAAGTAKIGNTSQGIRLTNVVNTSIGSAQPGGRNVISGNGETGISLDGKQNTDVSILGNYIGTNFSGSAALGNSDGVRLTGLTTTTTRIGGSGSGEGNLISGNTGSGVYISNLSGNNPGNNVIQGNLIGTNAAGTSALGNGDPNFFWGAILIYGVTAPNKIGGTAMGEWNVIGGNSALGVMVQQSQNQVVQGNIIGVDISGSTALGNLLPGVGLIDSSNNTIGGTAAHEGNVIAFSGLNGVMVAGNSINNSILGNSIYGTTTGSNPNAGLGIDLGNTPDGDGVTSNDSDDSDAGSNNLQNFPVLSSAVSSGGSTTVSGTLNSTANTKFRLEFFSSPQCNSKGYGEGQSFLGAADVTTSGNNGSFSVALPFAVANGSVITATATDPNGNTSEFSQCRAVSPAAPPVTIQLSSPTYTVNEGADFVTINVTRTGNTNGSVLFFFGTSDGTAKVGTDYVGTMGDLVFNPGVSTVSFNIAIKDNFRDDPDKTINVSIWNPGGGATLGTPNTAVVTIADDDPPPTISINDVSATEGNSGSANAVFTVSLSAASGKDVSVNYATSDGVASAASDYVPASGTLNIPAGSTSGTITVPINGDTTIEPDETFLLNLSGAVNATITKAQGTGTILDDDTAAGSLQFSSATYNANENGGTATITVTRTGGSVGTVTVDYSTPEGTADSVGDYTAVSGTLTFGDGVTQQSFTVPIVDDSLDEADETVNLALANPTGGATLGSPKNALLTILDNDAPPALSVSDGSVKEGNSGTINMAFAVSLSAASGKTVTVDYATSGGTATAGSDYQAINASTLTFAPGETQKQVVVQVNGDTTDEPDEILVLALSNAANATISKSLATGTILNDDSPVAATVQFSSATYEVQEALGAFTITVTRTGDTSVPVVVDYKTADGTALQRTDYTIAVGKLSFAAGEASKTLQVLINEDAYVEGDETLTISLANPVGGNLGALSTATITIHDDAAEDTAINTIDDSGNFVYQQYHDFLNREPDTGGLDYWTKEISSCGNDFLCLSNRRRNVSAAFFIEQEFQQTGYYVYRIRKATLGTQPTYAEFSSDRSWIDPGPAKVAASKAAFADEWVKRPDFKTAYPDQMTPDEFTQKLFTTAGLTQYETERQQLTQALANQQKTRTQILMDVIDMDAFKSKEYNGAFVLMQYFGFLRRDPDPDGYNFWLDVLNNKMPNDTGGYRSMVCGFVTSAEYQDRFGTLKLHSNQECAP